MEHCRPFPSLLPRKLILNTSSFLAIFDPVSRWSHGIRTKNSEDRAGGVGGGNVSFLNYALSSSTDKSFKSKDLEGVGQEIKADNLQERINPLLQLMNTETESRPVGSSCYFFIPSRCLTYKFI